MTASRLSYEAFVGEIPTGLWVLHKCDTPLCINPNHLYAGTPADNVRDMVARGRHVPRNKAAEIERSKFAA